MPTTQHRLGGRYTWNRISSATAVFVVAGFSLAGCASAEPGMDDQESYSAPITISVDAESTEHMVLGEIYNQVLKGQDRNSTISVENSPQTRNQISRLQNSDANFTVGCTGDLLGTMNPNAAKEVAEEYDLLSHSGGDNIAINDGEPSGRTYDAFVGSLPGHVRTTDPSPAQGCKDSEFDSLPQNIVPVFHKELFSRAEVDAINDVTRSMSTEDIKKLVKRAKREASVSSVVSSWLDEENSEDDRMNHNTDLDDD